VAKLKKVARVCDALFWHFEVGLFVAHLFGGVLRHAGCGATALALLTGENPLSLPRKKDWTRGFMTRFLEDRGFLLVRLTPRNVTRRKDPAYPITSRHVVLVSIRLMTNEASWAVIHDGRMYHNFEISIFKPYELLNHPVEDAYLVKHPRWEKIARVREA
jgi:hypothetical protein